MTRHPEFLRQHSFIEMLAGRQPADGNHFFDLLAQGFGSVFGCVHGLYQVKGENILMQNLCLTMYARCKILYTRISHKKSKE